MTEELKDKLKIITDRYIKEIAEAIKDNEAQILIIIYDEENVFNVGFGCEACAVQACEEFVETNKDAKHRTEKVH